MIDAIRNLFVGLYTNLDILTGAAGVDCFAVTRLRHAVLILGLVAFIRLCLSTLHLRRLRRRGFKRRSDLMPDVLTAYRRAGARVGIRTLPPLLPIVRGRQPVHVAGLLRPTVFLNPRLTSALDTQELTAVLAHELVHIRRGDTWLFWGWEALLSILPGLAVLLFGLAFVSSVSHSILALIGVLGTPPAQVRRLGPADVL